MTTAMTPDLLAHVAAVRDGACDDHELLVLADRLHDAGEYDREELIRTQIQLERLRLDGHGLGCTRVSDLLRSPAGRRPGAAGFPVCLGCQDEMWAEQRERELLARNPSWLSVPCPECGGYGHVGSRDWTTTRSCSSCGGTGDLLKGRATITRGFLGVALPAELCWQGETRWAWCEFCQDTWIELASGEMRKTHECRHCNGTNRLEVTETVPHPVLRAILASPVGPWVRRVRVEGREPQTSEQHEGWWRWYSDDIPLPIYKLLDGKYPTSHHGRATQPYWRTAAAAADALSLAVVRFARGEG